MCPSAVGSRVVSPVNLPVAAVLAADAYAHGMGPLPVAAVLATWLDAAFAGQVGPDALAEAVRGDAPRHLVSGLAEGRVFELDELPSVLHGPVSLALPAPGDPLGLGGPQAFNLAALDAGQALVVGTVGLVPVEDARTVVWQAHPADRVPWVDERETAVELRAALVTVTQRLVDLDVASWNPAIPDLLKNQHHRARLPLPPGYDARRTETLERALLCLEIVALARADDGGAVSSYEMGERWAALGDLDRAARRAVVGACAGRAG
jgi:hypothetical protein